MDQVLQGIDGVFCYLDDILITGQDTETHMTNLEKVLKKTPKAITSGLTKKNVPFSSVVCHIWGMSLMQKAFTPCKRSVRLLLKQQFLLPPLN